MAILLDSKQLAVLLLLAGGCSQILGLGDYEIEPGLDGASGEGTQPDGRGGNDGEGGGQPSHAGTSAVGGTESEGGERTVEGGGPGNGGRGGEGGGAEPVGAAGQAGSPAEIVPCDSEDCCQQEGGTPVGVELLEDGSFELAADTPWTEVSTNSVAIITNNLDFGFEPRTGDYFAYLGGLEDEVSTLYSENFVVPDDAGWFVLSGYRLFQIDTQDDVNLDFSGIGLYGPAAADLNLVELPFFWGRPTDSSIGWGESPTWKRFEASWDAAPHVGERRHLGIRGRADAYSMDTERQASAYLYDDVSLELFRCYR